METAASPVSDRTVPALADRPGSEAAAPRKAEPRGAPISPSGRTPGKRAYQDVEDGISLLPPYTRSLLKVKVTVRVALAATRQPLQRIVDLSPGSILQFNKPCDQALELEVGDRTVALGQAVKVGDKFGLWITSMVMPEERFWVVRGRSDSVRAK